MTLDRSRPFTRADALAAGISIAQLMGREYVRLLHGVYIHASVAITPRVRALAALRIAGPDAWVSHHTAGVLWNACMPDTTDTHVTAPNPSRRSIRRGVYAHRARPGSRPTKRYGVLVSPPTDVFLDLASLHIDLVDLVVAGDSLVKATPIEPTDLVRAASTWFGRGARLARRAACHVREGVDSPQESRLRMLLVLAGLPEPTVNLITRHPNGEWKWRFDLCYPEFKIIVEYDGEQHRDKGQQKLDQARREALVREGWLIIVITRDDLYGDPAGVLERVRDALRSRDCTRLRPRFASVWMRHFVARPVAA